MPVPAEHVKKLREMSGAPMMECKKALEESGGDLEHAFTILRKRGQASAAKKAGEIKPVSASRWRYWSTCSSRKPPGTSRERLSAWPVLT